VREHVPGIADQGNAIGEHAADYFHDHHGGGDGKREQKFPFLDRAILKKLFREGIPGHLVVHPSLLLEGMYLKMERV